MSLVTIPDNELNSFDLPRVCVMTGATEGISFKPVKFQWYPRWVPILVLVNLLVAALVAFILTKKVKGELPFTEEGYKAWKLGTLLFGLSIFGAILLLLGGAGGLASKVPEVGAASMIAGLGLPIGIWVGFVRGKTIKVQRIGDGRIELDLPSEAAALAIRNHLDGGRVLPSRAAA